MVGEGGGGEGGRRGTVMRARRTQNSAHRS